MTFYLKVPRGEVPLEKLYDLASNRIEFLTILSDYDDTTVDQFHDKLESYGHLSDSVAEGYCNDRIAHFILSLAILRGGQSPLLKSSLVRLETKLFNYRMRSQPDEKIYRHLRATRRHLNEVAESSDEQALMIAESLSAIIGDRLLNPTSQKSLRVPFQIAPEMVRTRRVALDGGLATIPASLTKEFLKDAFELMLGQCLDSIPNNAGFMTAEEEEDDRRISNLLTRIRTVYESSVLLTHSRLSRSEFDPPPLRWREVAGLCDGGYFPPCFTAVHRKLERRHRVGHHARVAYTLFLKEIGLPLPEALSFWQHHYSQPTTTGSGCCGHSWQADAKRYTYSLKGLYGQAGAGVDYSAHSCASIINRCSPTSELSCPFLSEDIEDFTRHGLDPKAAQEVLKVGGGGGGSARDVCRLACSKLLAQKTKVGPKSLIQKPSVFFQLARG